MVASFKKNRKVLLNMEQLLEYNSLHFHKCFLREEFIYHLRDKKCSNCKEFKPSTKDIILRYYENTKYYYLSCCDTCFKDGVYMHKQFYKFRTICRYSDIRLYQIFISFIAKMRKNGISHMILDDISAFRFGV